MFIFRLLSLTCYLWITICVYILYKPIKRKENLLQTSIFIRKDLCTGKKIVNSQGQKTKVTKLLNQKQTSNEKA